MDLIRETEELTKRKEKREKEVSILKDLRCTSSLFMGRLRNGEIFFFIHIFKMQATVDELEAKNAEIAEDIERMKLTNTDVSRLSIFDFNFKIDFIDK